MDPDRWYLLAILAVALGLRLGHLAVVARPPWLDVPAVFTDSDMHTYWQWAHTILAGDWWGRETYHPYFAWMKTLAPLQTWHRWWGGKEIFQEAPLYPYGLAGLLGISNRSLPFVLFVQLSIGAGQCLIAFSLGRRLFDRRAGLVAAAITACYGPFVFHQAVLLRDWLPPVLEPLGVLALLRARSSGRSRDWAMAGVVLGLALLTRETVLVFIVVAAAWVVIEQRVAPRQAVLSTAVLLAGLLLCVSPLVVRNVVVGAPALAVSNRAPEGIVLGNAADARPIGLRHPDSLKPILEAAGGRLSAVVRGTLDTYHGDWTRFVRLQAVKLRALADPVEVPNNVNFYHGVDISPALALTLRYGLILPLGIAGLAVSAGVWRRHVLLILYAASTVLSLMSTLILGRLRLVLVPVLILYAAAGLVWCFDAIRERRTGRVLAYVGGLIAVGLVHHLALPDPATRRDWPGIVIHDVEHAVAARIDASQGRIDLAVAEMERLEAKARRHGFVERADAALLDQASYRLLMADRLLRQGRAVEARRELERAEGSFAKFPTLALPWFNLGVAYQRLGDRAHARTLLERFLTLEPTGRFADAARAALAQPER
jgi:hypothetical protein